jgi:competence protein ComGC
MRKNLNLSSFLFPANKKGLTIVELLICFVLIAFVGFLTFSTINKSYKSLQKSAINVGMSESQSLALQKLSKSGVLKQILSTQISNAECNKFQKVATEVPGVCFAGSLKVKPAHIRLILTLEFPYLIISEWNSYLLQQDLG